MQNKIINMLVKYVDTYVNAAHLGCLKRGIHVHEIVLNWHNFERSLVDKH